LRVVLLGKLVGCGELALKVVEGLANFNLVTLDE